MKLAGSGGFSEVSTVALMSVDGMLEALRRAKDFDYAYSAMTGDTLAGVLLEGEAAFALGRERSFGSLQPGKVADFAVVDRDLTATSPSELRDAKVLQTYVGGEPVHER